MASSQQSGEPPHNRALPKPNPSQLSYGTQVMPSYYDCRGPTCMERPFRDNSPLPPWPPMGPSHITGRVLKGACHHSKPTGLHPSDGPTQAIIIASTGLHAAWQHEPPAGSYIQPSTWFTQNDTQSCNVNKNWTLNIEHMLCTTVTICFDKATCKVNS